MKKSLGPGLRRDDETKNPAGWDAPALDSNCSFYDVPVQASVLMLPTLPTVTPAQAGVQCHQTA